jgi:hypothetical protein
MTYAVLSPTAGLAGNVPDVNLPPGFVPDTENFTLTDGVMEPRPMLAGYGGNPMKVAVTGGREITDVAGTRYPLISGTTRLAYHTGAAWSLLSYVSAYGVDDQPAGTSVDYWDITQIYYPDKDDNCAIAANASYQSLYVWKSGTTVFSSLTGAPRAIRVTAFDNYLMTLNQTDVNAGGKLVQRVQWSDRGSCSSWTGGLSGFEDLLDMKGYGTRLWPQESRVLVFSDQEIWQGVTGAGPFIFQFTPFDRSVGCPYPWTIADTPLGVVFLGRDFQTYLLPKGGGTAVPVGQKVHRELQDTVDKPDRAWAVYDTALEQYQLYYGVLGGNGRPQRALYVDVASGSWARQSFDRAGGGQSPTMGFSATVASSATSWGGAGAAGLKWSSVGNRTWGQMSGSSDQRSVLVGMSSGTMYQLTSNTTSDDGVSVPCKAQFVVGGDDPFRSKTLTRWTTDYEAASASSMTVRVSATLGASFEAGVGVNLSAGQGQANADLYLSARYPLVEVQVEGSRPKLQRFYGAYRPGGR